MKIHSAFCGSEFSRIPLDKFKEFDAKYFSPVWSPRQWQLLKNKAHQHIAIWAESHGEVCHTLLASFNQFDQSSEIFKIVTSPNFRQRGIARKSFEILIESLVKLGIYRVFLQVEKDNFPAVKAYQSWGFVETRPLQNYYGQGRDGVEFLLEIDQKTEMLHPV